MPDDEIIQPLPDKYKDNFDLGVPPAKTERERMHRLIADEHKKTVAKGKPFCYRCAKLDYEKAQEEYAQRKRVKEAHWHDAKIDFDLSEYADKSRFIELKERAVNRKRIIDGLAQMFTVKYKEYYCKVRGCRHSIEVLPDEQPRKK